VSRQPLQATQRFNPRLTSAARRTFISVSACACHGVSIHASPQRRGERALALYFFVGRAVSIHASPQRRGERVISSAYNVSKEFQSTPHLSGEANCPSYQLHLLSSLFQSTPHLSGEANSHFGPEAHFVLRFNPRLTSAARRTAGRKPRAASSKSFNPRLTSAARRTAFVLSQFVLDGVSIHASPQRRGELARSANP